MASGAEFDFSEVEKLSATIAAAGRAIPAGVRPLISKGALNIKNATRSKVSTDPTWKHLADTVTYSMRGNAAHSSAEVGYEDRGQGELAGIAEFGSARHAPHPALIPSAAEEAPRFEKAVVDLVGKAFG